MGCCCSKSANTNIVEQTHTQNVPVYSWDERKSLDPQDYMLDGLKGEVVIKGDGKINGEQFLIRECSHCIIYLLDVINTVILEDCDHCKITIGPTRRSIFMRNCRNSVIILASGQLRLRDCRNLNLFVYTATSPILESSASIYFNCFQLNYSLLEEQFAKAELPVYNNQWCRVHDFTPVAGERNYIIAGTLINEFFPSPGELLLRLSFTYKPADSLVPVTSGYFLLSKDESYGLIFVLFNANQRVQARKVYMEMQIKIDSEVQPVRLLHTQEVKFNQAEVRQIFTSRSHLEKCKQGTSIGFLYSGEGSGTLVKQVCEDVFTDKDHYLLTSLYSAVQWFALKHSHYDFIETV